MIYNTTIYMYKIIIYNNIKIVIFELLAKKIVDTLNEKLTYS